MKTRFRGDVTWASGALVVVAVLAFFWPASATTSKAEGAAHLASPSPPTAPSPRVASLEEFKHHRRLAKSKTDPVERAQEWLLAADFVLARGRPSRSTSAPSDYADNLARDGISFFPDVVSRNPTLARKVIDTLREVEALAVNLGSSGDETRRDMDRVEISFLTRLASIDSQEAEKRAEDLRRGDNEQLDYRIPAVRAAAIIQVSRIVARRDKRESQRLLARARYWLAKVPSNAWLSDLDLEPLRHRKKSPID